MKEHLILIKGTILDEDKPKSIQRSPTGKTPSEVIECISDLIPNLDYKPWYEKQVRNLGYDRFMELVKKARSTSDTPAVLFKWMLRNNGIVK
jgi:hypothetical protein